MALGMVPLMVTQAAQEAPKAPKKTPWDYLKEGLEVAGTIGGLAVNYQTYQKYKADAEAQQLANQGISTPGQLMQGQVAGLEKVAPGTEGAINYRVKTGPGENDITQTALMKVARATEKTAIPPPRLEKVTTTDAQGNEVIKFVEPKAGESFISPPKPEKVPKDISVQERNTLQNQYDRNPITRTNNMVMSGYEDAKALMNDPSPAADQALIVAFVKAFDPTSVVKETEAETTQAMGSLNARAQAKWQEMTGGGKLTNEQRADLFKQIEMKAQTAAKRQQSIDAQFSTLAQKRGVDPTDLRLSILPQFEDRQTTSHVGKQAPASSMAQDPEANAAANWAKANIMNPNAETAAKARAILDGLGAK